MNIEQKIRDEVRLEATNVEVGPLPAQAIARAAGRRRRVQIGLAAAAVLAVAGGGIALNLGNENAPAHVAAARNAQHSNSNTGAPGPVSSTMHVDASMKYTYSTVAELALARQTTTIVTGTVTEVSYQTVEGLAMTTMKVAVDQTLKGSAGASITVHEDGGYLPASQVIGEIKEKYPDAQPTLDPNSYVDVPFEGAAHPATGEKVLLFLSADPNVGLESDYVGVMSVYSRFDLGTDALYHRVASLDGIEATTSLSALRTLLG